MAPPSGGAPVPPPYGAPGRPPQGPPPPAPYQPAPGGHPGPGYPGGGYPGGPGGPGFPAPPAGGGGGRRGLIIGIVAGVVVLVLGIVAVLALTVFDGDDEPSARDEETAQATDEAEEPTDEASDEPTEDPDDSDGTDDTEDPSDDLTALGDGPDEDPNITARAFLDSLLEGDCLAVEGLSTPDYFASEFTDQAGCEAVAGDLEMSNAEYTFDDAIVVGSFATAHGEVYAPTTEKTLMSTWLLEGSTGEWLVNGYSYVEK